MPVTNVDEKIRVVYSTRSTIGDLIEGLKELIKFNLSLDDNPSLKDALEYILGILGEKITDIENDLEKIEKVLDKLPEEIKEKTIEEFEEKLQSVLENKDEVVFSEPSEPETRLSQLELDELVLEYETATKERQEYIEKLLAKYENVKPSAVKQFIEKQQEILRENRKIEVSRAEEFANELAKNAKTEEEKAFIKETVLKVIEGEDIPKTVEAKELKLKTEEFIEKHRAELEEEKIQKINRAFEDAENESPVDQKELVRRYGESLIKLNRTESPDIKRDMSDVKVMMEANGVNPGATERASHDVATLIKSVYTKPGELKNIYNDIKNLDIAGLQQKYLPNIPEVRSFQSFIKAVDNDKGVMLGLQNMVHTKIKMVEGFGKVISKFPGGSALVGNISKKIGGVAMKDFVLGSMKVMTEQGMLTGAKAIMQGIISGTVATGGTAGGSTILATTVAAFSNIPIIGQIILILALAVAAISFTFKVVNKITGWVKDTFNINLWAPRDFIASIFGGGKFGRFVGTIGQFGMNAMIGTGAFIAMLFGPMLAASFAAIGGLVTAVIIGLLFVSMAFGLVTNVMVSSLVPPPPQALGGSCEPKEDIGEPPVSDGEVNCNQNAPEGSASISKEEFVKKANAWRLGGRNYARECYNDVVNRAKCAGVNPDYALAVWLHESGASNYGIANVEDFGIHGQADTPPKNFDKQITKFLSLKLGQFCPGMEYWLSFSTNFLTGTCDAERAMVCQNQSLCGGKSSEEMNIMVAGGILKLGVDVQNGTSYRSVFVDTFRLMDIAVPASATISKGGQNCGGSSANPGVAEGENEFVAADGTVMVCSGPVDSEGNFIGIPGESAYDPNAPGLEGELIPGASCSVAHLVVDTKQCGQSWSNKALPGGSGTICSAGCGPSSASSILRNKNGSMTPDTVIFEPGSAYGSMDFNGSSLGQADTTLKKYGYSTSGVQDCTQTDIANWIREGKAVVLLSHSDTGNGSTIGHILVAVAIDSSGKIFTKDPYYSNNTPFSTKGKGNIKVLRSCLPVQLGNKCQGQIKSQ